jgi:DNA-binding transcriptional MerR regulator
MSERPYLSIGEVLELLKGDFPDLSISRIRALESAGALELERTASGYRKFYDGDIAYLRTLLNGSATGPQRRPPELSRVDRAGSTAAAEHATASGADDHRDQRDLRDQHDDSDEAPELGPNGELPGEPERRHPAAFQSLRRELASRPAAVSAGSPGSPTSPGSPSGAGEPSGTGIEPHSLVPQLSVVPSGKAAGNDVAQPNRAALAAAVQAVDADATLAPLLGSRNPLAANASGISMTLDELVTATGLTIEAIRELESFGLLKGQTVFSAVYYDEDSLLTCNLVAAFRSYGVEPRHLRMYKLAADREASFFEQVVTPQLRRKNPDARQGAIDTLGELVRLGEQLRVVALRQVLKASINK